MKKSLPSRKMILDWFSCRKREALRQFEIVKKAEILASLIGTETEEKAKEWDDCVRKMSKLYSEMQDPNSRNRYSFNYSSGQYINATIDLLFKAKHSEEKKRIENELDKMRCNLESTNSPKKMLEYLKACDMEYPIVENVKDEPVFQAVDVTIFKPWTQAQIAAAAE